MDCIFCKIGRKEVPGAMIYEDDHAFAVLDIAPRAPGHAMVIPRVHAITILDLPAEQIQALFAAVKAVTARLQETLRPDGFTIGINHGEVSGQTVKHLHIHVIPRWKGDGGGSIHSVVNNPPQESVGDIARRIIGTEPA